MIHRHYLFPLTWEKWDETIDAESVVLHNVTFTDDFGKIKKGEFFYDILICYSEGTLSCYSQNTNLLKGVNFKVTAC